MKDNIRQMMDRKELAIAGVSRDPRKFGHIVYKTLREKGFTVYPVNPNTSEILGEKCYNTLDEVPGTVKNLLVVLPSAETVKITDQAIARGFSHIWFQQGSENREALENASRAGINTVSGKCFLMYAQPSGIHKFHATLMKIFGKY